MTSTLRVARPADRLERGSSATVIRHAAILAAVVIASSIVQTRSALADTPSVPETELAIRYSPIVMLKAQTQLCDTSGEQYVPAPVDVVLGNPEVRLLRGPSKDQPQFATIATGPTTRDIARLGPNYYLDLPGDPLRAGCTYATASNELMRTRKPTVYAHVGREPGINGIVVQYWIFYYFNQFNDVHEGDWEMIQIAWDGAASVEAALSRSPDRIAFAQHGGGELAAWNDPKLKREADHPVVFPAAGSHANYYAAELYLGTGQNGSGFGCDDALGPSRRVVPETIVVPSAPDPAGPFGWLTFSGRWGQYERGFNGGPDGPMQHSQWLEPFRWMGTLRASSPTVPLGSSFGPSVTGVFCVGVAAGSAAYNHLSGNPWLVLVALAMVVLVAWFAIRRTVWSPAFAEPLDQHRRSGQMLVAAGRVYRARLAAFLTIGALFVPISIGAAVVQHAVFHQANVKAFLESASSMRTSAVVALIIGTFGTVIAYTLVLAIVAAAIREHLAGRRVDPRTAYLAALRRLGALIATQTIVIILLLALSISLIGLPLAIRKAVDWTFTPWQVVVNGRGPREALHASTRLVRGCWWNTAVFTATLVSVSLAAGPLLGFVLIFTTPIPLSVIDIVGSIAYALVVPYTAITLSLLYLELRRRGQPGAVPRPDVG